MRWLIVEDSLESRRGHWFEYLEDFCSELPKLGDEVTLLVSRRAEPFIQKQIGGQPVLPESAYGKMSDGAPAWRRYARIPIHAWKTFRAVRRYLRTAPEPDVIFVPTVIVHHLLAWTALVKLGLLPANSRVLLFFPGLPIRKRNDAAVLDGSPTSKLKRLLLFLLKPETRSGKVILGVETQAMKQAAEQVFGVPFTYFPHTVEIPNAEKAEMLPPSRCSGATGKPESTKQIRHLTPALSPDEAERERNEKSGKQKAENRKHGTISTPHPGPLPERGGEGAAIGKRKAETPNSELRTPNSEFLTLACYGPARHEKGSDFLAAAIEKYLERFPDSRVRFVFQWLEDFAMPSGEKACLPAALRRHPRVEIVDRYFAEGEYAQRLAGTQVLLLPYRRSSYALRVSRVVIEAMVHGLPVVATRGTTLAEQAKEFGAAVLCEDENVESLVAAMQTIERDYEALAAKASERQGAARGHFSVNHFREVLTVQQKGGKHD